MLFFYSAYRAPECDVLSWNGHTQWPPLSQPGARWLRDSPKRHMEANPSQNLQLPDVHHTAPQPPSQQLSEASETAEAHPSISAASPKHALPPGAAGSQRPASAAHVSRAPLQRLHPVRHRVQLRHGDSLCYPLAPSDGSAWSVLQPRVVHQPHIRYLLFINKFNKN